MHLAWIRIGARARRPGNNRARSLTKGAAWGTVVYNTQGDLVCRLAARRSAPTAAMSFAYALTPGPPHKAVQSFARSPESACNVYASSGLP